MITPRWRLGFRGVTVEQHPSLTFMTEPLGSAGKEILPKEAFELPHSEHFLTKAISLLKEKNIEVKRSGTIFQLSPGTPLYQTFYQFFIDELTQLPFNNERGSTIMRDDAVLAVHRFVDFLGRQFTDSENTQWNPQTVSQLKDLWYTEDGRPADLEVFKNQIYPDHKISGIGYSLDLSGMWEYFSGANVFPPAIVLNRYYVNQDSGFNVSENGSLKFLLNNGTIEFDSDDYQLSGSSVHLR